MLELPEARVIAGQVAEVLAGKKIVGITVGFTPHKLAWYYGDRSNYADILEGKVIEKAAGVGGLVEINAGGAVLLFGDGVGLRYHKPGEARPAKHQLLLEFENGFALSAAVQMYGGLGSFLEGTLDNPYYLAAREKPSPFSPEFDLAYFTSMVTGPDIQKLSAKAFLATEQRIPGLGNGVLQDILYNAGIHPKRKVSTFSGEDTERIFNSIKTTLTAMFDRGGRDTELDLFGCRGGYQTLLSKNTVGKPCPVCGTVIKKESYLGGSIYYCEECQHP